MSPCSRRGVLLGSVVVGLPLLTGCGGRKVPGGAGAGASGGAATPSVTGSGGAASSALASGAAGGAGAGVMTAGLEGQAWEFRVGPTVVKDGLTVVRLSYSPVKKDDSLSLLAFSGAFDGLFGSFKLLAFPRGEVYGALGGVFVGGGATVKRGEWGNVYTVFEALPEGVGSVAVFVPHVGVVADVPVVVEAEAGFDVAGALAQCQVSDERPGPRRLRTVSVPVGGGSDTSQEGSATTVSLSGDVTFASGSAELSAEADQVLAAVVSQLGRFPSGGGLEVTGHTDDVLDEASNQVLSEQRAKAVAERLGQLTSLSAWKVSQSGKGEGSPRVPNDSDEHRRLNRRVEVVLSPARPEEGKERKTAPGGAVGALPAPEGPVGKGPEGVDVTIEGQVVRARMESVTRWQGYLMGSLLLSSPKDVYLNADAFALTGELSQYGWGQLGAFVCNMTLLEGGARHLIVDGTRGGKHGIPVSDYLVVKVYAGQEWTQVPAVWADTGQDTVVLDLPGGKTYDGIETIRLTDIPVKELG